MNPKATALQYALLTSECDLVRTIESFPGETRSLIEHLVQAGDIRVRFVDGKRCISHASLDPWSAAGSDLEDWLEYVDPDCLIAI